MSIPARHELPGSREVVANLVKTGAEKLARKLGGTQWKGEWTPSYQRIAYNNAALRAYQNPTDPAIRYELELSACASAATHLATLTPGTDPIRAPAPGGRWVEVTRTAGKPKELVPAIQWREGVLAAVVTRNADALGILTKMRFEELAPLTVRPPPPWFEVESRALSSAFHRERDASDLLLTAAQTANSDRVADFAKNWIRDVIVPELELGLRTLQGSRDKFDAAMEDAIVRHHHYYGTDGKDDYRGQLALAPLAMASFAHDAGVTTTVESDYTPRWLIERTQP